MKIQNIKVIKKDQKISKVNELEIISDYMPNGSRKYGFSWSGSSEAVSTWLESLPLVRGGSKMKYGVAVRQVPQSEQYHYGDSDPVYLYITEEYLKSILTSDLSCPTSREGLTIDRYCFPEGKGLYLFTKSKAMDINTAMELLDSNFFNGYWMQVTSLKSFREISKKVAEYEALIDSNHLEVKFKYEYSSRGVVTVSRITKEGLLNKIESFSVGYNGVQQVKELLGLEKIEEGETYAETILLPRTIKEEREEVERNNKELIERVKNENK